MRLLSLFTALALTAALCPSAVAQSGDAPDPDPGHLIEGRWLVTYRPGITRCAGLPFAPPIPMDSEAVEIRVHGPGAIAVQTDEGTNVMHLVPGDAWQTQMPSCPYEICGNGEPAELVPMRVAQYRSTITEAGFPIHYHFSYYRNEEEGRDFGELYVNGRLDQGGVSCETHRTGMVYRQLGGQPGN